MARAEMLLVQERSSVTCTHPLHSSTVDAQRRMCALLMSAKISFVLSTFRERLLSVHHTDRQLTSLLLVYFCDNEQAFPACLYYGLGFFHNLEHNFFM